MGRARMGACRVCVGRTGGRREHVADSVLLDDAPIPELGDRRRSSVGLIGKAFSAAGFSRFNRQSTPKCVFGAILKCRQLLCRGSG